MKKLLLLLFFPLLFAACSAVSKGLTEEDVAQYIKAYNAIAAHSSELDKLQKQNDAISLMTCGPCLARLDEIVQGAGYKDMKTFLAMDLRMHITMRAWLHVAIGKLAGQAGQSVAAADLCSVKEEIVRSQDPKEMALHCARLKTYSSYLDKLGALAVQVAEKLLQVGDIDVMARHADAIANAWSNEKLPYDFRHGGGEGFDD